MYILGYHNPQDSCCGNRWGRLYYLDENRRSETLSTGIKEGDKTLVWLWHRCLGHLSYSYLKKLKPSLFLQDVDFQCDVC